MHDIYREDRESDKETKRICTHVKDFVEKLTLYMCLYVSFMCVSACIEYKCGCIECEITLWFKPTNSQILVIKLTCNFSAVSNPAQCGWWFAPRGQACEFHLSTLHCLCLHLHCRDLRGYHHRQRRHLVVCVIGVELTEVAALVRYTYISQRDPHQARREKNHLKTVVFQC